MYMKNNILLVILVLGLFTFSACNKEVYPDSYTIKCTVLSTDSIPAQNVLVRMYAPVGSSGLVNYYKYTDESGIATFNYRNRSYLVLDARKGAFGGCNAVELDKEEEVHQTVYIYPFGQPNGCTN